MAAGGAPRGRSNLYKIGDVVRATGAVACGETARPGDLGVVVHIYNTKGIPYPVTVKFFVEPDDRWPTGLAEVELVKDTATC